MEHRHMSNQLMIPPHYQHENNHLPVRGVVTENGRFVTPTDHPITGGAHFNPSQHLGGRPNGNHSSNTNLQTHNLPPPFSRPPFGPYIHTSTDGNTSLTPVGPVGHIHPTHSISESGGPGKRKSSSIFEGSSSSFYGAGSSSSSQMLPYRGVNLSINGPDSTRNVRRRLEPCMTSAHVPNYDSQYYQPTTHPANYAVPVQPFSLSADVTGREWNTVPYAASYNGRTSHPDIRDPRRETNQFYAGGGSVDVNVSHYNPSLRGNMPFSSQNPHVSHIQPTRDGHSYHHQRVTTPFYRNDLNYRTYTNGASSSSTNELQFPSENLSSRYSNYTAAGEWGGGGYIGGRSRLAVGSLQPVVDAIDYRHGFGHETVTIEQSSFYQEPNDLPDEYQDMRLDIDDMSYEELLALEESIGYVSSGLSEDGMSKCLREKIYYSIDQNCDTCPICLEEYKNGEKIGRIEKCGHEYHVDCIKKWVMMKKVCPICKSEC